MTKLLDEIHPGEILLEDFMKPMGIAARGVITLPIEMYSEDRLKEFAAAEAQLAERLAA